MRTFDLVIIGTGSANSIVNERFADWNVAFVEAGKFGGTCLNMGCIPTKMFVHTAEVAYTPSEAARLGVDETFNAVDWPAVRDRIFGRIDPIEAGGREWRATNSPNQTVFAGEGRFTGPKQLTVTVDSVEETITAPKFVIAAGGRPQLLEVEGLAELPGVYTSDTVMRIDELPSRMVIVGAGFIAAEFAHVFSSFGVEVTVLCRSEAMLRAQDDDVSARFTELAQERWDVRLNTQISKAEQIDDGIRLHTTSGAIDTELVLVAIGRVPNTDRLNPEATGVELHPDGRIKVDEHQRTNVEGIFALGDISSDYQLKHVANHEARVVHHNLLHPDSPKASDHRFVPEAVFTHPQVAKVGLTEREARERGINFITATQDYADIAYGWAMEDTTGFLKLLADPDTGQLLGAHIIGPQASTLIQPLIQAMSFGLPARKMATDQYWIHPAMPELVENALLKLDLPH
ncbi:mycothione reductase [Pseudonocardiaceae bacterium YIM PH 21723]|nr:mycothione reductase [Pseudonocardiaceae bacterium YIM PH 21723]